MSPTVFFVALLCFLTPLTGASNLYSQSANDYTGIATKILEVGLRNCEAYELLEELTTKAGPRLSGSAGAEKAVALTKAMMESRGFDNVHLEGIQVPHWVRGDVERAVIEGPGRERELTVCALGGTIGTPKDGVSGEVVEVKSFDELGEIDVSGKIVFYNRPFDPTLLNTFAAYGGAVDQRSQGAIEAAKVGAVATLVRSMTLAVDDIPHTGVMHYSDDVQKIPSAAISTIDAEYLSELLRSNPPVIVRLTLRAETLHDVPSHNVIGELTGTEFPDEVIVVCGHLDSWDKGTGAHDDGAGCVQAIEALSLLRNLGLHPKRTIRAVMYMNEENGLRGGKGYVAAPERRNEMHYAAIESDAGGFAPRGISVQADSAILEKVQGWNRLFKKFNAGEITGGYSGVDISPLADKGVPCFGLIVESQRYFDYHHSDNDTLDKVNRRELELGAIVEAMFCFLLSEEGL